MLETLLKQKQQQSTC